MKHVKQKLIGVVATILLVVFVSSEAVLALSAGSIGTWTETSTLLNGTSYAGSVVYNGFVYEVGGFTSNNIQSVYYAQINSDGTLGTWNTTTSLPTPISSSNTLVSNGYIYEIGGNSTSNPVNTAYYAQINSDGTLGTWNTTTSLPQDEVANTSIIYNGYVYIIAGDNGNGLINTVYFAQINSDGTLGTWNTTTSLPVNIFAASSVEYGGYIYEIGGYDGNFENTVYFAQINSDGTLGTWNTTTSLPSGLSDATAVEYNGYVFDMGGVNNGGSIDSIYAAPLLPGGGLGTWSMINSLPEAATSASSVINNGYVYEIGGFGNGGNGSTGNTYFASILGYLSPTLIPQTVDISSGSSTVVNVLSGASGDPDPNSLAIVSGPAHGIAVDPPGTITYTPNSGYSGSDSLTYKVCSLDDESLCSFGTLNFNVVSKSVVSAPDTGFGVYASATYRNIYVYASLSGIFIMFGLAIRRQKK